jgi:hypothetical protein
MEQASGGMDPGIEFWSYWHGEAGKAVGSYELGGSGEVWVRDGSLRVVFSV